MAGAVERRRAVSWAISCLALWLVGGVGVAWSQAGWELAWADEFDQADGSVPDPAKWGYDIGGWGWGNEERQYYTDRPVNARIEDGCLVIEAREEPFEGNDYTSARLVTKDKWTWRYGRIEARIQVPRGQGIWPAFWMLGDDFGSVGWPQCGEIDIMEHIGREPRTAYGTIHGPGYSGSDSVGGSTSFPVDLADAFHLFAIEWEENAIRWYVDDILFFTATPAQVRGDPWVFDHPFFLILNVAVGGRWPGYPDDTTVFPQQMRVAYVRVYAQPAPAPVTLRGTAEGDAFHVAFDTQHGYAYRVVSGASPLYPVWMPVGTVPGDGSPASLTVPIEEPWQFYAVEAY
jgi:beta-glucanase (GH16 family)